MLTLGDGRRRLRRALARRLDVVHPRDGRAAAAAAPAGSRAAGPTREALLRRGRARSAPRVHRRRRGARDRRDAPPGRPRSRRRPSTAPTRRSPRSPTGNVPQARTLALQAGRHRPAVGRSAVRAERGRERRRSSRPRRRPRSSARSSCSRRRRRPWIRLAQFELLAGDAAAARDTVRPGALPRSALGAGAGDLPRGDAQAERARSAREEAAEGARRAKSRKADGAKRQRAEVDRSLAGDGAERAARAGRPAVRAHRDVGEARVAQHARAACAR